MGEGKLAWLLQNLGVSGLCTPVVWLASLADPGDNDSQRISVTEGSGFIPLTPLPSLCRMSDCVIARGQVWWHPTLDFIVSGCLGTAELVRDSRKRKSRQDSVGLEDSSLNASPWAILLIFSTTL